MNRADEALTAAPELPVAGTAHVLLVDDEPLLRRFASRVLSEGGYVVHEATDGADALEQVSVRGDLLDVVVSDIVMPRVNGVELLQALSLSHPELPVVLMSGYGVAQLSERGIAPPCGILAKPFEAERLLDEVKRCLRDRS